MQTTGVQLVCFWPQLVKCCALTGLAWIYFLSVWVISQFGSPAPQILIVLVPGYACTPKHTQTSCLLSPLLDEAK